VNVAPATPLLIVVGTAAAALIPAVLPQRRIRREGPALLAFAGLLAAAVMCLVMWGDRQVALGGGYRADRFSMLLNLIFIVAAAATLLLSYREPAGVDRRGEYTCLVLAATAGMMLVAGGGDLITIFLGIEILSVALYVLCALEVWRERSLESGLKYLIIGSVGSAILLYGLTFLFGATGTTDLTAIGAALEQASFGEEPLLVVAMALILAGLGFKVSAAPFHMWAPDVYEGAPSPITAFMATAVKAAAFAAFLRLFTGAMIALVDDWRIAVAVVAAIAVIVGNLGALLQTSFKRLLAYSSIAQAGYLLIGVAAGTIAGAEALLYYLIAYGAMTLAAFAILVAREREVEDGQTLGALAGYARVQPVLGVVATVALLSLAGFPPLSGFLGKFLLFGAAVDADLTWLAVVGAVGSMISLAYYLRVIYVVWGGAPAATGVPRKVLEVPAPIMLTAVTSAIVVVALVPAASLALDACRGAAEALLAP
jgi:NADH-quinone oxidoreductase subunit N